MTMATALIYPALALATTAAGAAAYVWYQKPSVAMRLLIRYGLRRAGLTLHYVDLKGGERMCYAARGAPSPSIPSIVLVHGFSASKDNWISVVQRLPRDIHVMAVDMIGHGDSSLPPAGLSPTPQYLTECLHEMLEKEGMAIRPFHLIGTSMGGMIGCLYTISHPENVLMLSAVCPAVHSPVVSDSVKEMRETHRTLLLPKTVPDMFALLELVLYHTERIPKNSQMLKGFLQMKEGRQDFYQELFKAMTELVTEEGSKKMISKVTRPVQILWGVDDKLLHVSGAEFMKSHLPDCRRMDLLERCGHAMSWDQPRGVTDALLAFRTDILESSDESKQAASSGESVESVTKQPVTPRESLESVNKTKLLVNGMDLKDQQNGLLITADDDIKKYN